LPNNFCTPDMMRPDRLVLISSVPFCMSRSCFEGPETTEEMSLDLRGVDPWR
jgi:hypothetical protein